MTRHLLCCFTLLTTTLYAGESTLEIVGRYGSGPLFDIEVKGDYAFTRTSDVGLVVYNVADPSHMYSVGYLPLDGVMSLDLEVDGNVLVVTTINQAHIIDISEPSKPQVVYTLNQDSEWV